MEGKQKSNTLVIVLIMIILCALTCALGWFIGTKSKDKGGANNTETPIEEKEENYDLNSAKQLVDKYANTINSRFLYIDSLSEQVKLGMVLEKFYCVSVTEQGCNHSEEMKQYDINSIKNYSNAKVATQVNDVSIEENGHSYALTYDINNSIGYYISYNDFNNIYKTLFGKDNNASKVSSDFNLFYYDSKEDRYLVSDLSRCMGGSLFSKCGAGRTYEYEIQNATKKGNVITVDINSYHVDNGAAEKLNETKSRLVFKYDTDHYVLESITKM